jgi:hypothetical protein
MAEAPIAQFFARYVEFEWDQTGEIVAEFKRLCVHQRWGAKKRNTARARLRDAIAEQFNAVYGSNINDLTSWQLLCTELRLDPPPGTITQCRKVREQVAMAAVYLTLLCCGCRLLAESMLISLTY